MKRILFISALLAVSLAAGAEGLRREAGKAVLEPLQKRDSILVGDQIRLKLEIKDVAGTSSLALPEPQPEPNAPLEFLGEWQLDSTRVSKWGEKPTRYNLKASIVLTAFMGGTYNLPDLPVLVDGDTLVYRVAEPLVVTEPAVDMESFTLNDIKPPVDIPITPDLILEAISENIWIIIWIIGGIVSLALLTHLIVWLVRRRMRALKVQPAEPAHVRALRKLDEFRGEKYWKPEHQKAFYSGVTDALREYIAARYKFGAMEMTTAEVFDSLKGTDVPEDLYGEMKDLFERADFVKFAKFTAPDEDNAKVLPGAVRFVTETYQQEIAGKKA
ncbi:MAG: hypothetical protein IK008_03950 [Bacteroidales bacterium]|nr:hypothetical protein [Bacteroidales bacterium]